MLNEKSKGQSLQLLGGEPSRHLELIRSLSLLNGLIPEIDVNVKFSGEVKSTASYEETDLLQSLTPGVMMGVNQTSTQSEDKAFLTKLTELLEKGQTAKIVALLEKINPNMEDTDQAQVFKLAG